jgi:hypothetical protein
LVAGAAEQAGHNAIVGSRDLLLHLHGFEDEQRGASLNVLAGLHKDMNDLPGHRSAQIPSSAGDYAAALAGVKEVVFASRQLQGDFPGLFEECDVLQELLSQLEDVLAHGDAIAALAVWQGGYVHLNSLSICGTAPVREFHGLPPIRQPS